MSFSLYIEILEFETNLWESIEQVEDTNKDDKNTDDMHLEARVDPSSCGVLLLFFRALLELCPTLKRVHVTLLSETDAVRFVVYIGELTRLVSSAHCLHIENLFFLGHHAVISDRKPVAVIGDCKPVAVISDRIAVAPSEICSSEL